MFLEEAESVKGIGKRGKWKYGISRKFNLPHVWLTGNEMEVNNKEGIFGLLIEMEEWN